jgi:hypothetical protein
MSDNAFDTKRYSRVAIISSVASIVGAVGIDLKRLDFISHGGTLSNVLTVVSITGYSLGITLGIIALVQIKKTEGVLKGKLSAFLGILLGVLGLSFTAFATYALYKLRHM